MNRKFLSLLTVFTILLGTTTSAYAVTPMYKPLSEYGYTGVTDVDVELSDGVKQGVDNAVQEALKKYTLTTPKVAIAKQYSMFKNNVVYISWGKIDGATGYDIKITNSDGTTETYHYTYNLYYNMFKGKETKPVSVRVRAADDDGHLSYWSTSVEITSSTLFNIK